MAQLDENKLHAFVGKMLADLGGAFSVPTVRLGLRLGLFEALHDNGPVTAAELAQAAGGLTERYVREWALAQAASGYIDFDSAPQAFSLSPEQTMVFVTKDSPVYLEGAFDLVAAMIEGEPKVERSFRTGTGVRWGDSAGCLFCATGAFFRPGYVNNIVQNWLPALAGVEDKLTSGAKVADVGCGVGFSTILMAKAYPNTRFIGYDFHEPSVQPRGSPMSCRQSKLVTRSKPASSMSLALMASNVTRSPSPCVLAWRLASCTEGSWKSYPTKRVLG